ncbi:recombinase family protein [Clostridium nigeriense]|uniref:recombinase family protein n=1 Tax=Clostridium nigeriense TaxID=1805470 RepID=UPI003D34DC99
MKVAIYLRKSRADEELEKTVGQGETLAKHRKALLKIAKERKYDVTEIKEEIISGESLFHRPKMIELLNEVESKKYEGVLVMDMQRLGRGDMQDQGIILKTFKESNTKIITPQKTYDLNNDFDEEYSEFEAFMSRKELKMITRRMQGGRQRSVEDGNYLGTNPPLGYDIEKVGRIRTLKPNDYADVVKLIFKRYTEGYGTGMIAQELNSLGYKSATGKEFERTAVLFILKNLVYIGKITWRKKEQKKSITPGKIRDTRTRDKSEWIVVDGKHPAIIDENTFFTVQKMLEEKYHVPYQIVNGMANPLAGVVICGMCGSKMILRKYGNKAPHIMCTKKCGCKSSRFDYVEKAILEGLSDYLNQMELVIKKKDITDDTEIYKKQIELLTKELNTLKKQKNNIFDLFEQGMYDEKTFIERSNNVSNRIDSTVSQLSLLQEKIEKKKKKEISAKEIKDVIDAYEFSSIEVKNKLLKSVLYKVEYKKNKEQKNDDFEINLFPKIYV